MKTSHGIYFLFLCTLAFSGCLDITEEFWLNKDRSGRYEMTVTLSAGPMAGLLRMAQEKTNDSLRALGQPPRSMDTLIRLADLPDSLKIRFPHRDVLENTTMQATFSSGMGVRFQYNFKKPEDITRFWETLETFDKIKEDSTFKNIEAVKSLSAGNLKDMVSGVPEMQFEGKQLRRSMRTDTAQETGTMLLGNGNDALFKMMFRNKTYRLIFHLPKKVKSVQGAGFIKDGKTVSASFPMQEVLKDKKKLDCVITIK